MHNQTNDEAPKRVSLPPAKRGMLRSMGLSFPSRKSKTKENQKQKRKAKKKEKGKKERKKNRKERKKGMVFSVWVFSSHCYFLLYAHGLPVLEKRAGMAPSEKNKK